MRIILDNASAGEMPPAAAVAVPTATLDQLAPNQSATVLGIDLAFELRERLAALGVKAGRRLQLIHRLGRSGPLQVRVGSTDFILRIQEAANIRIAL